MKFRTGFQWAFAILIVLLLLLINRIFYWGDSLAALSGVVFPRVIPLLLMAAALGTDAMSLSVGIGIRGINWQDVIRVSLVIGAFHIIMPLAGSVGGHYFGLIAGEVARWVGAGIVAFIGIRMLWGCLVRKECPSVQAISGLPLIALAVGVSLDALSVGFGLGAFGYNIYVSALIFGIFGGSMTAVGLLFGSRLGNALGDRGELLGGSVLIILALHMFFKG